MKGASSAAVRAVAEVMVLAETIDIDTMAQISFTVPGPVMVDICSVMLSGVLPTLSDKQKEEAYMLARISRAMSEANEARWKGEIQ